MELTKLTIGALAYVWGTALVACVAMALLNAVRAAWLATTSCGAHAPAELETARAQYIVIRDDWRPAHSARVRELQHGNGVSALFSRTRLSRSS